MTNASFLIVFILLSVLCIALLVIVRLLDWRDESTAHRMTRARRRQIDREIKMANPQLKWRGR